MVLVEDKHYQIIPDKGDEQAWNVRILSGTFTETVLKFGVVKFISQGNLVIELRGEVQPGSVSFLIRKIEGRLVVYRFRNVRHDRTTWLECCEQRQPRIWTIVI